MLPKDDELGLTGVSLSAGLRAMVARTGAATPFVKVIPDSSVSRLLAFATKRVERSADRKPTVRRWPR